MFNCIYSRSKADNSEMVTVQLIKLHCFPFMIYSVEAVSLSSADIRILENCINRAMYRIFGACDSSSMPASVAQWAETQCAPTGTVCQRSRGSIPGRPVDFVFGFQGGML